jgi:hypothetical protein
MLHVSTVKVHHQARIDEEAAKYLELPVKLLNRGDTFTNLYEIFL